ncbi:PEP-CTERM sorting domain-containing protein [Chlorobaculum sp. 24CR]|uniref:PEP-CTERM sorting domain-containing protein n=1 Tax=Chlorobaculum sp. 24CR TaxID=2508878 RepID=UPI00100B0CF9|nr:PEP-CTERM sorting domain-containing protein [Chlorobaculum sp. 24CR]RXK84339.1 PEP-CTERM sorting domain-containing protein [Chlorobaculum sp. 24CR]
MKAKATAIGILFTTLSWTGANAAVISHNDITGDDPGLENPYTANLFVTSNISATGIGQGSGISGKIGDDRYNASGWSDVFNADDYFTFTLDANAGYRINIDSFEYHAQRSSTGPTSFAFRSSIDGFTTNIGSPTATGTTIDLTASQFQHLTDPIEFRLYGYNSGVGTFSVNDYTFNGTVEAVPEPGTLALVGVGSLLMFGNLRRTRKKMEMAE